MEYIISTNNIIVVDSYLNFTNKSNLTGWLQCDSIRFFDQLVVAYFFGPPCIMYTESASILPCLWCDVSQRRQKIPGKINHSTLLLSSPSVWLVPITRINIQYDYTGSHRFNRRFLAVLSSDWNANFFPYKHKKKQNGGKLFP